MLRRDKCDIWLQLLGALEQFFEVVGVEGRYRRFSIVVVIISIVIISRK